MSYVSSLELRKVRPEAVSEKSVLESVVDLFHDVVEKVPQAYSISSRSTTNDQYEIIEWTRFLSNAHEWHPSIRIDTLVLLIAYKNGLSLWTIENNGIANELFSIREHNLSSACLLITNSYPEDSYFTQRPLIALAKSAGPPCLQIRSLKIDQKPLKTIDLPGIGPQSEPLWIESNKSVLVCATHTFIIGYDIIKFDEKFFISSCYSSFPFALSSRWLALTDVRLNLRHQSIGGIDGTVSEQNASYTGTVLNAAKSISKSVAKIGESFLGYGSSGVQMTNTNLNEKIVSNQAGLSSTTMNNGNSNSTKLRRASTKEELQPGVVTIVDTIKLFGSCIHDERQNWIIAHFQAHAEPVGYLQFNPSGHLLVTCDNSGHYFNVLEIRASPYRCTRTHIIHLYTLFRGDTDCKVSHMTFTTDSRWLAISTKRGTTHLFAINPYGGAANVRTHTKTYVVNKASRYHRTVGLDEQAIRQTTSKSNNENGSKSSPSSPLMNSSASIINGYQNNYSSQARIKRASSDCVFTTAVTLIRQPTENFVSGLSAPFNMDSLCLAATFGISRGFLNPEDMINHQEITSRPCSSLFVISWHGRLIEYVLDPRPDINKSGLRVTSETPLAVTASPKAQWQLQKLITWPEVRMSVGYSFLSQGHRPTSANKVHSKDDWLRQVEINTSAAPHRRLWMGPQFQFKHYSEATVSICHPNSNVFTADSPQTSMNVVDADLNALPVQHSKSTPVYVPVTQKDISPAYIEFGSGSFQDAPSLSIYGSSLDSLKSDLEIELVEKLADAAVDISLRNVANSDTTDSLSSSTCSSTVVRSLQNTHSVENMIQFPDIADTTD